MFLNCNSACSFDDGLPLPVTMAGPSEVILSILQVPSTWGLVLEPSPGTILCQTKMTSSLSTLSLFLAVLLHGMYHLPPCNILYLFCCLSTLTRWQTP